MSTELSNWSFRIKDASGNTIANLINAGKKSIKLGLNKSGEASFTYNLEELDNLADKLSLTVDSLIGLGRNSLVCVRGHGADEETYFAGQIISMTKLLNADSTEVEIKAMGYFWLLGTRIVGLTEELNYVTTDAGSIAWSLINVVQSETYGDFGITQGSIQTSVNRTIGFNRKTVKEAIEELAVTDNGFDFEITENKVFNVFYPIKGSDKSNSVIFRYPSNHVIEVQEIRDAADLANSVLAIGSGFGLEEISAARDAVSSQEIYVKREKILPIKDMNNATVLGDMADEYVNQYGQIIPFYKIEFINSDSFTPKLSDFGLGDYIKLIIELDYYQVDQSLRVFEISINIDDNDLETVYLTVGLI